ncbi:MAG: SDR family NAD(P)-dependent oxidoreductase [Candidatus Aminicenantes bacterium]|nr:SDR family NAD(P)-dependent oxidoreductase [Candidatus Aminicenantes bacterium]
MAKLNFENKWVLVTGASSGLGRAIALYLSKVEKANLIIAARRKERLEQLKTEIESAHNTKVEIIVVDLNSDKGVDNLFKQACKNPGLYAVINNAGVTYYGRTTAEHLETYERIIAVDFRAVMKSSLLFLDYFREKGAGAILNVTSMAAFTPLPYQNVYAAAKHAAQAFTEALYQENKDSGVVISSFAPGGIATEMNVKSGLDKKFPLDNPFNMKAEIAARKAIKAFKKKKYLSVPGFMNKLTVFLSRFFSRKAVTLGTEIIYRPPEKN